MPERFLTYVEEKASALSDNVVTRLSYGILSGKLFLKIAQEEQLRLEQCNLDGSRYLPNQIFDFETYALALGVEATGKELEASNAAVCWFAMQQDLQSGRNKRNPLLLWLMQHLPWKLSTMFLSDTYYKKQGFLSVFKDPKCLQEVILTSCRREDFDAFLRGQTFILENLVECMETTEVEDKHDDQEPSPVTHAKRPYDRIPEATRRSFELFVEKGFFMEFDEGEGPGPGYFYPRKSLADFAYRVVEFADVFEERDCEFPRLQEWAMVLRKRDGSPFSFGSLKTTLRGIEADLI